MERRMQGRVEGRSKWPNKTAEELAGSPLSLMSIPTRIESIFGGRQILLAP